MHDMNFFAIYKKQRAKNKNLRIFIVALLVFLLLLNGALVAGGLYLFDRMEAENQSKRDWINNPDTKAAIQEAEKVAQEVKLVTDYYNLLQLAGDNLAEMKQINSTLLDEIRQITPTAVTFQSMAITGRQLSIGCQAETMPDALDFYHALVQNERFVNETLSSISIVQETGAASFSVTFMVKED